MTERYPGGRDPSQEEVASRARVLPRGLTEPDYYQLDDEELHDGEEEE